VTDDQSARPYNHTRPACQPTVKSNHVCGSLS